MNLIPPPLYGAATLAAMWLLQKHYPLICSSAEWPVVVGWIIVLMGAVIDLVSILSFRKVRTTVNPLRPENTSSLITDGLYSMTRNPMYLGMAIMLTGAALIMRCLSPLFMPLVFCLVVTVMQIFPEEKTLQGLFGDEYRHYKRSVGRWI